jgi:ribosomal protein S12 methylthiotransferase accessory factor
MDIRVSFPGGKRVDAHVGDFTIRTDQPRSSQGDGSAPAPYDLFLASLASCAGFYALAFCQARSLPTEGLGLSLRYATDPDTHLPTRIAIDLQLPRDFPEKYRPAIARAVEGCKVKKTIAANPAFEVNVLPSTAGAHAVAT